MHDVLTRRELIVGALGALGGCAGVRPGDHHEETEMYDVIIAGGGPAGLSAALVLGRARKRVLLCDAGPPRNAAAEAIQGFVTRDGTAPSEFRRIGLEQLAPYPSVHVRGERVAAIHGGRGDFLVVTGAETVRARRVLLCTGLVDVPPALPGLRELWGKAVVLCPYCHGWEARDRRIGCLATSPALLEWSLLLRGWTADLTAFTQGAFEVPPELRARLHGAGVRIVERPIGRLVSCADHGACGEHLDAVELDDGVRIPLDVLFVRPIQQQTELGRSSHLRLDKDGLVEVSETLETSRPGVFAAGDLTTLLQGSLLAAAAGARAAYALNHELTLESLSV